MDRLTDWLDRNSVDWAVKPQNKQTDHTVHVLVTYLFISVYQEWEIVNNTFVAMVMREGDKCGSNFRTVRVGTCIGLYSFLFSSPSFSGI